MQDGQQGQVITPGGQSPENNTPQETEVVAEPAAASVEVPEVVTDIAQPTASNTEDAHVSWTASEYVANPKSVGWFITLAFASIILAAVAFLITRDVVSTVVIILLGIIVGVFAARQPQVLEYSIDSKGIHIGNKFYAYASFKSFSIAQEHAIGYISLMPLKRFMPPLAIHYEPQDEDRIADTLADYLPFEEHKPDMVDSFTRRIRF